jgi:hypothetical protein
MARKEQLVTQPPPDPRRRTDWQAVADDLRSRPGEWACFPSTRGQANSVMQGHAPAISRAAGFEHTTRKNNREANTLDLWIRYVGDEA